MSPTAVVVLAVLAAAGDVVGQLPEGVQWSLAISEEASTGEADGRPTLEIIARSRAEFESLCLSLGNKIPSGDQTELLLRDGGLEVAILDPAWTADDAELKTRSTAIARLIRANEIAARSTHEKS
jgi:hypothetical protein